MIALILTFVYNVLLSDNYAELEALASSPANSDGLLMPLMVATGFLSVMLTLSIFSVVMVAGPIMVNIIGFLKDLPLTYLGLTYFSVAAAQADEQ